MQITTLLSPNRYRGRTKPIRLIVIHTMEVDETSGVAEAVARAFANPARKGSSHLCVDNDSAVRCVADADTAWCAPGANADGLQLELAGRAGQGDSGWTDAYSVALLENAAQLCADWVRAHGIPCRRLSIAELKAGQRGFIGHIDATNAYHQSTHWDPGPTFPWNAFLDRVAALAGQAPIEHTTPPPSGPQPHAATPVGRTVTQGDHGPGVLEVENILKARGFYKGELDSIAGPILDKAIKAFQKAAGILPDGVFGPISRAKAALVPTFPGITKRGTKGTGRTRPFQAALKAAGFDPGKLDDDHGPKTDAAMGAYQKAHGLVADRIGGPITWTALHTR